MVLSQVLRRGVLTIAGLCLAAIAQAQEAAPAQSAPSASSEANVVTVPVPVAEKNDGGVRLEEITVTSTKRAKSQRDIPGSVGAIRGEELEKMHAQGMKDYLKRVPGIALIEGDSDSSVPVIRGIATNTDNSGFTQLTTGIYADDLPFTDVGFPISIPDLNPFDLERVEVLKGPQGTLFGSGALAGAVRYILQKPKHDVWEGKLTASGYSVAEADKLGWTTGVALNAPLFGDALAFRAVGMLRSDPGWYDDIERPAKDVNSLRQNTGRVLGSWHATDRFKLSAMYFRQESKQPDVAFADNRQTPTRASTPFPSPHQSKFTGSNLLGTYAFDWATLLSSTSYTSKHAIHIDRLNQNAAGTGVPQNVTCAFNPNQPLCLPDNGGSNGDIGSEDQSQTTILNSYFDGVAHGITQELRLSSPEHDDGNWEWLAGGFYQSYKQRLFQIEPLSSLTAPPGQTLDMLPIYPIATPVGPIAGSQLIDYLYAIITQTASDAALFGEVTRRLGAHWEATIGVRAFRQELTGETLISGIAGPVLAGRTEQRDSSTIIERGINPKFSLRYKHNRNVQSYLQVARGYQFGGVQLNPPLLAITTLANLSGGFKFAPFKSSKLWNYELGLRTEWLQHRLRFDAAMFYMDWKDLQLTQYVNVLHPPPALANRVPPLGTNVIGNVASAHSEGAEMAIEVAPFTGVSFTSSVALISALTDEDYPSPSGGIVPAGTRLPGAPRFQWSNVLSFTHRLPIFNSWEGALSFSHVRMGPAYNDLGGTGPIFDYDSFDASVSLRRPDSKWLPQVSFDGHNLTDVRGVTADANAGQRYEHVLFIQPRTLILTLNWHYI